MVNSASIFSPFSSNRFGDEGSGAFTLEPRESPSTPPAPEADQKTADTGGAPQDAPRQSPAMVQRRSWLAYVVVAALAGLLGVCAPAAIDWLGRGPDEAASSGQVDPLAGEGAAAPGPDLTSVTPTSPPAPATPPPSEPAGAVDEPIPGVDAPLPTTQAELIAQVNALTDYVVKCFPAVPDALDIKARYQNWLGNSAEAVRLWERCLELDPRYGYAFYGMGTVAAKRADYAGAADLLQKALSINPEWPEAELESARALLNLGRSEEAVKVLEKNIRRQPAPWEPHLLLGQAHAQRKDYVKAKEVYGKAIQSGVTSAAAYHGLAMASARLGETDQARQYLEKFRELEAGEFAIVKKGKVEYDDLQAMMVDTANVFSSAAQLFLARKRPVQAEKLWRRAAAFDSAHVRSRQGLAWLCRSSGRIAEAIGFLQQLAEIDRGSVACLVEIGRLEADLKHFDAAEAALRTACQRAPKEAEAHAALAQLYLVTNRNLVEARRLAEKAVELEPAPVPYVVLAAVCEKQDDLAAAAAAMKRATELDPGNPGYRKAYEWIQEKQTKK